MNYFSCKANEDCHIYVILLVAAVFDVEKSTVIEFCVAEIERFYNSFGPQISYFWLKKSDFCRMQGLQL